MSHEIAPCGRWTAARGMKARERHTAPGDRGEEPHEGERKKVQRRRGRVGWRRRRVREAGECMSVTCPNMFMATLGQTLD